MDYDKVWEGGKKSGLGCWLEPAWLAKRLLENAWACWGQKKGY